MSRGGLIGVQKDKIIDDTNVDGGIGTVLLGNGCHPHVSVPDST